MSNKEKTAYFIGIVVLAALTLFFLFRDIPQVHHVTTEDCKKAGSKPVVEHTVFGDAYPCTGR
jgi:hypothetical protein